MKYPIYKQDNHYSCGAYCIQMILKYHHIKEEIKTIKDKCKLTPNGISVYGMITCLEEYNIEAKAYQCTLDDIQSQVTLPCIIHTIHDGIAHYMVLYKFNKEQVVIGDPGTGLIKMPTTKLQSLFSGVCISIQHVGRRKQVNEYLSFYTFIGLHLKEKRKDVMKIVGYSMGISLLSLCSSFYFQMLIDTYKDKPYVSIIIFTMVFMVVTALKIFLSYTRKEFTIYLKKQLDKEYVSHTLVNMVYLPVRYFTLNQEGIILHKIQNLYQLSEFFVQVYTTVFMDSVFIIIILIGLLVLDITITIIIIITLCTLGGLCYYSLRHINALNKEVINKQDTLQQSILEYINNMSMIHQYHLKYFIKNKISYLFNQSQNDLIKRELLFNQLHHGLESILQGVLYIVVLLACLLYQQKDISVGDIIVFYMLCSYLVDPLLNIVSLTIDKEEMSIIFERYKDLIPNKKVKKKKIKKVTTITLDHISYSYGYSQPILEDVDLTITKSLYLKGETGCGKSTLLQLLMGYDEVIRGEIRINNENILNVDLSSLQQRMYYLHKQPIFFNETLKFNLLGTTDFHVQKMVELLQLFSLSELITHLEEKIDKDGGFLSSGQQQIVMIIRAIIKRPDVLILDEALSNIDEVRARKILVYLETMMPDTILIIVSHQTNIVNVKYDCVIIKDRNIIHGE